MSSAADRFVRARKALRTWGTALEGPVLLSQALVRDTPPELLIPLRVARAWAVEAAGDLSAACESIPAVPNLQRAIQALYGYYLLVDDTRTIGPFDSEAQARAAGRACFQHGATSWEVELRQDPYEILRNL